MDIIRSEVVPEKAYPTLLQAWGIFGICMLCLLFTYPLVDKVQKVGELFISLPENQWKAIQHLIGYLLYVGLVLVITVYQKRKVEKSNFRLSFRSISWKYYVYLLGIIFLYGFLIEPVVELIPMSEAYQKMFESFFDNTWITAFTVSLLGPILEELVFRGVMLDGFLKQYTPVKSILLSAFFFGLIHLNPWQFINAFGLGCLIGWLYWKTKSLWPCLFIHIVNNSLFTLFSYWANGDTSDTRTWVGNEWIYWPSFGCIFLVVARLVYLIKIIPDKSNPSVD